MSLITETRLKLGIASWPAVALTGKERSWLEPLDPPAKPPCRRPQLVAAASPEPAELARFRALETEAKHRAPARPLPCCGRVRSSRLRLAAEATRRFLPVFITGDREDGTLLYLDVAPGASAHVVLLTLASEAPVYVDVTVGENAHLQLDIVKCPGHDSWQLLSWRATVGRFASLIHNSVHLDSSAYQVGQAVLAGEGAELTSRSAALVESFEEQRIDVTVSHSAAHSRSLVENHGVVQDRGHGFFAVRGRMPQAAQAGDCRQESRFLMLSPRAEAHCYPVLEIDQFDVAAGHAASVGGIDPETLYYLQSRGLGEQDAQRLVTTGFLSPAIHQIRAGSEGGALVADCLLNSLAERI
ncbi:MAG: SufD family Fe-S cluster assembly protein [Bacillota bacterium]|nr:SufD family Fe-S cluster assembly protein [Bacillota bacterium]